jgi:hypothetical protein
MKQLKLINILSARVPQAVQFKAHTTYYWSPAEKTVYYQEADDTEVGNWTLLHEACHAILWHENYQSDFELLQLEVGAWHEAEKLALELQIELDHEHVQDCLDSYRDWQYKRSLCPTCDLGGVQINQKTYQCFFCEQTWTVSGQRFCRPYRRRQA